MVTGTAILSGGDVLEERQRLDLTVRLARIEREGLRRLSAQPIGGDAGALEAPEQSGESPSAITHQWPGQ